MIYVLVALVAVLTVPINELAESKTPLAKLVNRLRGNGRVRVPAEGDGP